MSDVPPSNGASAPPPAAPSSSADRTAPITQVAHNVLAQRLHKIVRLVAHCARAEQCDPDAVHELRVAIRRGDAALRTFRPLLPRRRTRRLRKRLRQLRRAAGRVRDFDVLHERLAERDHGVPFAATLEHLQTERRRRLRQLQHAAHRQLRRRIKRRMRQILQRVRWRDAPPEPTLAAQGPALLLPIAAGYRRAAAEDLRDVARLHAFRVSVKRLRYACEFLRSGLDDAVAASLLVQLAELQQRLGAVCDHASAIRLLGEYRRCPGDDPPAAALADILQHERDALAARQSELIAWWTATGRDAVEAAIAASLASADR